MRLGFAQDSTVAACKRRFLNGFLSCAKTGLDYCRRLARRLLDTLRAKLSRDKPPEPHGPALPKALPAPVYPLLLPFFPERTTEAIMIEPKHQSNESSGENACSADTPAPVQSEGEDTAAPYLLEHKELRKAEVSFPRVYHTVELEPDEESPPEAEEADELDETQEPSLDMPEAMEPEEESDHSADTSGEDDANEEEEEETELPPDMPGREESRQALHALLFVSDRPMSAERLANALGDVEREVVVNLLNELRVEMAQQNLPYELREIAGGYQLTTRAEHAAPIRRLLQSKSSNRLSKAVLETLAIIAYKQPVTRATVEAIRGVSVSHAFEVLQEKRLIKIAGVAEQPGRPKLYRTTDEFLVHFGIKSLKELPSIEEIREMG